jgi:hypothetical protein
VYAIESPRIEESAPVFSLKKSYLCLVMIAPVSSFAANTCIAVNGGFGSGGTTFIGSGFALPAKGTCAHWSGFAKTATTVILTTSGAGCLSNDGKVLTLNLSSANPNWIGTGQFQADYIRLCPTGVTGCPLGAGFDFANVGGPANPVTCTSSLLQLPAVHD